MNKKGIADIFMFVAALVVAGVIILALSGNLKLGGLASIGDSADVKNSCVGGQTQSFEVKAADAETNTLLTEAENAYREVGARAWTSFTQDTAITGLTPGKDYEFVMGIDAADEAGNAYGEYFVVNNLVCVDTLEKEVRNDEVAGSLTATFYNADNNAAAQALTAGQTKWTHLRWVAGAKETFGNPYMASYVSANSDDGKHSAAYPNCLCMNLNSTSHELPEVKVDGVTMSRISQPVTQSGAAGHTTYCYEAPVIYDEDVNVDVRFEADGSVAITMDEIASLHPGGAYIHSQTGELHWGCSTDDGNPVGDDAADTLTLDFT